jgi:hypothetical protein
MEDFIFFKSHLKVPIYEYRQCIWTLCDVDFKIVQDNWKYFSKTLLICEKYWKRSSVMKKQNKMGSER